MDGYVVGLFVLIAIGLWFVGCLRKGYERAKAQTYAEQLAAWREWEN